MSQACLRKALLGRGELLHVWRLLGVLEGLMAQGLCIYPPSEVCRGGARRPGRGPGRLVGPRMRPILPDPYFSPWGSFNTKANVSLFAGPSGLDDRLPSLAAPRDGPSRRTSWPGRADWPGRGALSRLRKPGRKPTSPFGTPPTKHTTSPRPHTSSALANTQLPPPSLSTAPAPPPQQNVRRRLERDLFHSAVVGH